MIRNPSRRSTATCSLPRGSLCLCLRQLVAGYHLLVPGIRAVRRGVQRALGVAREAERLERLGRAAGEQACHLLADAQHLEAVVGVGYHVDVWRHEIEDREVVGREGADAAVRALLVGAAPALEAVERPGQAGGEVVGER